MTLYESILRWIKVKPDNLKTQEMYNKTVHIEPHLLAYVPDHFKKQEMCDKTVTRNPYTPRFIPDHLKTQEMCDTL